MRDFILEVFGAPLSSATPPGMTRGMKIMCSVGIALVLGGCAAQSAEEGSRLHAFGATFIVHGIGAGIGAVACFGAAGDAGGSRGDGLVGAGVGLLAGAALVELLGAVLLVQGDGGFERELERAAPVRIGERPAAPAQVRAAPEVAPVETSTAALEQLTPLQRWIREKEAARRAR